jgi:hypothetical protein
MLELGAAGVAVERLLGVICIVQQTGIEGVGEVVNQISARMVVLLLFWCCVPCALLVLSCSSRD